MSTPFPWQKLVASHLGGTRDPLVVSWPARIQDRGGLRSQFTHVTDVAATVVGGTLNVADAVTASPGGSDLAGVQG